MLTKDQKIKQVDWITQQFKTKPLVVFTTYRGLNIVDMSALRRELKGQGIGFKVVKSSLLKIALKNVALELDPAIASLPLAIACGQDEVMPAKLIVKFIKDHEALQVVGGVMGNQLVDVQKVKTLAALPSRDELYLKLVGLFVNPAHRFVNAIRYPGSAFIQVVKQKFVVS